MAGLFGILDVAASGLRVTQGGIRNVSNNIANVNTPGYSRQRQVIATSGSQATPGGNIGTGVQQVSVDRVTDPFVQAQIVRENAAYGSTDMQASALSTIEEIFNEQTGYGIADSLSAFYSSFSDLSSSETPGAPVEREAVVASAENLIDQIHAADRELRDLQRSTQSAIDALVPEINETSRRIAELNQDILELENNGAMNELRDERDGLVRSLAEMIEIDTYENNGQLTVVLPSGLPLVEGGLSHQLVSTPSPGNPFSSTFTQVGYEMNGAIVDVTSEIGGGQLGGLLRIRDDTVPDSIRSLDTIAYNLVVSVNDVHDDGVGLDGSIGNFFTDLTAVEDAAREISLDSNILASADAIAAGLTSDPGDNRNALELANLRELSSPIYLPGDPPGAATGPSRTLLEYTASFVADVGHESASMQRNLDRQTDIAETLANRREEVSGVSIDEETTLLIQLEASYQANARVLQVIDGLLDEVLNLL